MKKIFLFSCIGAVMGIGLIILHAQKPDRARNAAAEIPPTKKAQPETYAGLNGTPADLEQSRNRPVAVMVENYPAARPQSGLADADMAYETLAEGGITRFLAVFQLADAKNIGPVRSARTYYADIANEIGALYAHVGGNSDVLANIRSGLYKNISDADQFFNDAFFRRITARRMPHNVYTSVEKLDRLAAGRAYAAQASYAPWKFKDDAPAATTTATALTIDFSLPDYLVVWKYDRNSNAYLRTMAGAPHRDADSGRQISAKNVVVQYVKTFPVQSDTPLSIGMDLESGGQAAVFFDGNAVPGFWKKSGGRTRFYDSTGSEISFNRGKTWVELVPAERRVIWR